MSDPPSYDQHLLDRLNALKKSSIQIDQSRPKPISDSKPATPESDLSSRLRSLRNGSLSPSPSPAPNKSQPSSRTPVPTASLSSPNFTGDSDPLRNPVDLSDKTLDELLAELGNDDEWRLHPDDPADVRKLLDEAKSALPRNEEQGQSETTSKDMKPGFPKGATKPDQIYLTRDLDMSVFALDDEDDDGEGGKASPKSKLEYESQEAQDIVAKLLDEINIERQNEAYSKAERDASRTAAEGKEADDDNELSLPSAPSELREVAESSKKSLDFESDITARMAALKGLGATNELGLPSAPTFMPAHKPVKEVMKKYTDEEIDTWCSICSDDATVECIGCDRELFCARCWKEGHMGPDAGYEEKLHTWTKFTKPR